MRIFLSYASEDKETADRIFLSLVQRHKVFFDHTELKGGDDFDDKIREEIKNCELFIFLISPHSIVKSSYALTELRFAREKWSHPEGHVLPVIISETSYDLIPPYLKAVTILEPEGNLVAEVRARVEDWQPDSSKSRVGITKFIAFSGAAIVVLAIIGFAVLKIFESNSINDKNENQSNQSTSANTSTPGISPTTAGTFKDNKLVPTVTPTPQIATSPTQKANVQTTRRPIVNVRRRP